MGRARHQLRGVLGARRTDRPLPVRAFRATRDRTLHAAGVHRRDLAWLPARCDRRLALWLPRISAPTSRSDGHRFNHNKLLLDPYARALAGSLHWSDALYGFRPNSPRSDLSFDRRDSAPAMPKSVVTDDSFNWGDDRPPAVPWSDTVIYEAHVRGLTMLRDDIRPHERGTFAALAHPAVDRPSAPPRHHRDRTDAGARLPAGPLPCSSAACAITGATTPSASSRRSRAICRTARPNEMRVAVRRLHAAGIEVILDVVYNHTGESDEAGPDAVVARARQCQLLPAGGR